MKLKKRKEFQIKMMMNSINNFSKRLAIWIKKQQKPMLTKKNGIKNAKEQKKDQLLINLQKEMNGECIWT